MRPDDAWPEGEEDDDDRWAHCNHCGWWGEHADLLPDDGDDPHPCGKDECPECHKEGCICCCIPTWLMDQYEDAATGGGGDLPALVAYPLAKETRNAR